MRKGVRIMEELLRNCTSSGVVIGLTAYGIGSALRKCFNMPLMNSLMIAVIFVISFFLAFGLSHEAYVTLLPKSITTAIGIEVSEELGGHITITAAVIIITGVLGNFSEEAVCGLSGIRHSISRGLAIGTASHAIGTSKALEMGEAEGAMSSFAIVVSGILTVIGASMFSLLL